MAERRPIWKRFFPASVDFYGLLLRHAECVHEGVWAFHNFLEKGRDEDAVRVRELEKEADEFRRRLRHEVFETFSPPIDREDLFYLSRRLDEIINYVKHALRDIQILGLTPSSNLIEMSAVLVQGAHHILEAIRLLPDRSAECGRHARAAKNCENDVTKIYQRGLQELFEMEDVREILKHREVQRHVTMVAERIDEVADVVLHIVIKEA
jgi:uncharacterized protein Yka (UPF0111/DUF47 family)